MDAERKRTSGWYRWLWLSPLLTVPAFIIFVDIGYMLVCEGQGICDDWRLAQTVSLITAVLLSSLWHLVLLKPVLDKDPFVHWHGLQALCLAGLRTAVPLLFILVFDFDLPTIYAIPVLIAIWFIGTLIGQKQAGLGKCSLAQFVGRGEELARYQLIPDLSPQKLKPLKSGSGYVEEWVNVIRFSQDSEERRQALAELKALDMVEDF